MGRKAGVPNKPREVPKTPYFLKPVGSKVKATTLMDAPTDAARREYLDWAVEVTGMDMDEIELQFNRAAFLDAIKKDKAFKAWKESSRGSSAVQGASGE